MSDFKAKMHQNRFRLGLCPRSRCGSLQRAPRPPSWIKGSLLLREREGIWEGRRGGKGGEGRGGEGKGRHGTPNILLHPQFQFFLEICLPTRMKLVIIGKTRRGPTVRGRCIQAH